MARMPLLEIAPGLTLFLTALRVTMVGQGLEISADRRMATAAGRRRRGAQPERGDR